MDKKHCVGCRQNFYNSNNPYGIAECWNLKTAKLIRRKAVHVSQRPPWTQKAQLFPSCYSMPGHVMVGLDQTQ